MARTLRNNLISIIKAYVALNHADTRRRNIEKRRDTQWLQ